MLQSNISSHLVLNCLLVLLGMSRRQYPVLFRLFFTEGFPVITIELVFCKFTAFLVLNLSAQTQAYQTLHVYDDEFRLALAPCNIVEPLACFNSLPHLLILFLRACINFFLLFSSFLNFFSPVNLYNGVPYLF